MKILTDAQWREAQGTLAKLAVATAEISTLKNSNSIMGNELRKQLTQRPPIDVKMGDPSPLDREQRTLYVAKVAGLHKDVLEPKLKQMISGLHLMLEEASNDREYDQSIKGAIYFAWEMLRWGDLMISEQISIQQGERPENSEEAVTPN